MKCGEERVKCGFAMEVGLEGSLLASGSDIRPPLSCTGHQWRRRVEFPAPIAADLSGLACDIIPIRDGCAVRFGPLAHRCPASGPRLGLQKEDPERDDAALTVLFNYTSSGLTVSLVKNQSITYTSSSRHTDEYLHQLESGPVIFRGWGWHPQIEPKHHGTIHGGRNICWFDLGW